MKILSKLILVISCIMTAPSFAVTTGQTLYTNNCAGCHGSSPSTGTLRIGIGYTGPTIVYNSSVIVSAITNYPAMNGLSFLTMTEINDISAFIHTDITSGGLPIPQTVTPLDNGRNLYNVMCSSCHGDVTQGHHDLAKGGNGPAIQAAINKVSAMRYLGTPAPQVLTDIGLYVSTYAKGEKDNRMGGCTIGNIKNSFDPLFLFMMIVSGGVLVLRRKAI
jgi:mono/diheme cytochrome c family protein